MVNQDSTLRFPMFHEMGRDDAEQHWFTCEEISYVKRITDEATKIAQLETTFRDRALMWYMKYKAIVSAVQVRSHLILSRIYLGTFLKPKFESQCITEIKEIKKKEGETVWD
jgi:hypothetical protein